MQLDIQKRLAAKILKTSPQNIWLDPDRLDEVKESITKMDIRSLIKHDAIKSRNKRGISGFRIREKKKQKSKGRMRGPGSIKGAKRARLSQKEAWMSQVRVQRRFLQNLRDKNVITTSAYRMLYLKSKGGFFRSKRHIKIYMQEHGIGK